MNIPPLDLKYFNATKNDVDLFKNNIFIGISVGVKPMSEQLARQYIEWSVKRAKDKVKILIADEIARFNYLVFSHSTQPGAFNRAKRDGDKYVEFFTKELGALPDEIALKVDVIRWQDITCERFNEQLNIVQAEFESNVEFRNELLGFIEKYTERRKPLTQEKKIFLANYLLHELPTLLDGIYHQGVNYNCILYPTYVHSGMSELVCDIQNGKKFQGLAERLKLQNKTIMVEALIKNFEISVDEVLTDIADTYQSFGLIKTGAGV